MFRGFWTKFPYLPVRQQLTFRGIVHDGDLILDSATSRQYFKCKTTNMYMFLTKMINET